MQSSNSTTPTTTATNGAILNVEVPYDPPNHYHEITRLQGCYNPDCPDFAAPKELDNAT